MITTAQRGPSRLLTLNEVADILGVSRPTLNRYVSKHRVPTVRLPGGWRRVRREDLDRLLDEWREGDDGHGR